MTVFNVCLTFDVNYSAYAKVLLESINKNLTHGHMVKVFILTGCDYLLKSDGDDFKKYPNLELFFVDIKSELKDFTQVGRFPPQVFARLFMHRFIENRVLYLDVDVIVRCCLSEIFLIPNSNSGLSACVDEGIYLKDRIMGKEKKTLPYFNAGMLLCDLENINLRKNFELAIALGQKHDYLLADQDALNCAFSGVFNIIPQRFNDMSIFCSRDSLIVHFAHVKPTWQLSWFQPYKEYFNYVNQLNLSFHFKNYKVLEIVKKIVFTAISKIYYRFFVK